MKYLNNKKVILVLIIFCIFVFKDDVFAQVDCNNLACAECIYSTKSNNNSFYNDDYDTYTFNIKATGSGTFTTAFKHESFSTIQTQPSSEVITYNDIKKENILSGNTLTCPMQMYVVKNTKNNKVNLEWAYPTSDLLFIDVRTVSLSADSTTNGKPFTAPNQGETENPTSDNNPSDNPDTYNICKYTVTVLYQPFDVTIQGNSEGTLTYNFSNPEYSVGNLENLDFSYFKSSCPEQSSMLIICSSTTKKCDIKRILTPEELEENKTSSSPADVTDSNCSGVLGDAVELFEKYFDWIKYGVCILLIVLGSLDFTKAVVSNDEAGLKKATSSFTKRVIAAIIIFFLPYIIGLILSLPGVPSIEDALCGIK